MTRVEPLQPGGRGRRRRPGDTAEHDELADVLWREQPDHLTTHHAAIVKVTGDSYRLREAEHAQQTRRAS